MLPLARFSRLQLRGGVCLNSPISWVLLRCNKLPISCSLRSRFLRYPPPAFPCPSRSAPFPPPTPPPSSSPRNPNPVSCWIFTAPPFPPSRDTVGAASDSGRLSVAAAAAALAAGKSPSERAATAAAAVAEGGANAFNEIRFFKNGRDQGVAFSGIKPGLSVSGVVRCR